MELPAAARVEPEFVLSAAGWLAGADDAKFVALAERMVAIIGPAATARTIPGAGHAAHLERPATVVTVLRSWLHTLPPAAGRRP